MPPDSPDRHPRALTIRTIAEAAGVHASTVSRALRRPRDQDEATARIWAIADELGYRPDPAAAMLRTGQSRVIGVLVHHLTDAVQALLYEAIENTALEFGYEAVVASTHDTLNEQRRRVELMISRRVDGLIVTDAHLDGRYVDWLDTLGTPFVLLNRRTGERPAVTVDEYLGGRLAGTHLADLGHTRIGILSGPAHSSAATERTQGCLAALRERGIDVPDDYVEPSALEADVGSGREAMQRLIARAPDLTAVFAVSDLTALDAGSALRARGLRVGEDVALVGYNDIPVASSTELSTISCPHGLMASIATRQLLDAMAGRPPENVRLAPRLVVRGTSVRRQTW